jgi:hypothetical protein
MKSILLAIVLWIFPCVLQAQTVINPPGFETDPVQPTTMENVKLVFVPGYDFQIFMSRLVPAGPDFNLYIYRNCLSGDGGSSPPLRLPLGQLSAGVHRANLFLFCEGLPDPVNAIPNAYREFVVTPAGNVVFQKLPAVNLHSLILLALIIGGIGIVFARIRR